MTLHGTAPALVELSGVVKQYQALRPLRIAELRLGADAMVSIEGLDAHAAEVLVSLITAALRPDAGQVHLFGQSTAEITNYDGWLAMLDGVGLVTERAVLLDQCTVAQNLALPFTIEIDPIRVDVLPRVGALAREVGLDETTLATRVGAADPEVVQRVRLGRALALGPRLVVAEHPSATLPRPVVAAFAADLARIVRSRGVSLLSLSADREFTRALGGTALTLDPRTGALTRPGLLVRLGLA